MYVVGEKVKVKPCMQPRNQSQNLACRQGINRKAWDAAMEENSTQQARQGINGKAWNCAKERK